MFHTESERRGKFCQEMTPDQKIEFIDGEVILHSGGTRELAASHHDMAAVQMWIKLNIRGRIPLHDAAHGFVAGRRTKSNAIPHVRREVVVNADLEDFFPSITFPRVKGTFHEL